MRLLPNDYVLSLWASVAPKISTVTIIVRRGNQLVGAFYACSAGTFAHKFERHSFRPDSAKDSSADEHAVREFAYKTYANIAVRNGDLRWMEIDVFSASIERYQAAKNLLTHAGFEWQWDLMENFDVPVDGGEHQSSDEPITLGGEGAQGQEAQEEAQEDRPSFLETDAPPELGFEPPASEFSD